jgi:hypothetical protein
MMSSYASPHNSGHPVHRIDTDHGQDVTTSLVRAVCLVLSSILLAAIFTAHTRWVYTHFSSDAYLLDSGWLAYLFGSADPALRNPAGVNDLSFYAHHVSPHIFLFGWPLVRAFHLSGIRIFAYHQGLFFGLFFLALMLPIVAARLRWREFAIATVAAISVGAVSNALLEAAAYPHYEIAMTAIAALAIGSWLMSLRALFSVCLLWLPVIREDGGLFVAFVCLACASLEYESMDGARQRVRPLLMFAGIGVAATAFSLAVKAIFFPGFDTFSNNLSGHHWDHVSAAFVAERLASAFRNVNIVPVVIGTAVLTVFDRRYAAGLVLLSPLYALYLLSVRPEHGHFRLYFALPWLLPCVVWLAVFIRRSQASGMRISEAVVIAGICLTLAAPVQAAAGLKDQFWYVARWAFTRPVYDLPGMQEYALWTRKNIESGHVELGLRSNCVSMGVAALIPNAVRPTDLLQSVDDVARCRTLLLMRGDMQYAPLSAKAISNGFANVANKATIELWWSDGR